VQATFLAFGFVPVKATLELTELTPISIVSVTQVSAPPYRLTATSRTEVSLRVYNVHVNGVLLKVGSHCGTSRPIHLTLVGKGTTSPPTGYNVPDGGPLTGFVTIPSFRNCGVTENLDPLFDGTISGPHNYDKMTQGKTCGPSLSPSSTNCPPPKPKPLH